MGDFRKILKDQRARDILIILVVASVYFVSGKLGLTLAFENPSATAIWPPTGIALAAFLLLGYRIFSAIFIGAFLVNLTTAGSVLTSIGIATGNTLEGLLGAYLINRFCGGLHVFDRPQDIFKFAFLIIGISTAVSATIGTLTLLLGGYLSLINYQSTWLTWWLGDIGGALIIAPLILLWVRKRLLFLERKRLIEAIILLLGLSVISLVIFGDTFPYPYTLPYFCIPILVWIALRRTQTETITSVFMVFLIVTINTLEGIGPFATEGIAINQSLHLVQMFLGTVSIMMLVVSSIVTDRKREEVLRERLATIVHSSNDAIYSMNLSGIITTWNRGAAKIFGYQAKEMVGQSISLIFPENKKNELQRIINTVKKGKHMIAYESDRQRKDGRIIPISVAASPLKDMHGNTIEISIIARDISREKELEKRKDEFISMASHELNTPITGLSIYVQALGKLFEKRKDKEAVEYLAKMDTQIQRIRHVIRDLLDISRIRLGMLSFSYSKFSLNMLVKDIVEAVQYIARRHTIVIKGRARNMVVGDKDRIAQVLTNLLSNARKYSPAGKKIIVKINSHKKDIVVSVQDFGIGIGKKHQEKVFELFYRIEEYHGKTFPGMGIGLYLSFQIIEEHKGKMWFESRKGKGTTFYFSLPLGRTVQAHEHTEKNISR